MSQLFDNYSIDFKVKGNRKGRGIETPRKRLGIGYFLTSIEQVGQKQ